MASWFVQYNIFLKKDQDQKAAHILLQEIDMASCSPLVYLTSFHFFSSIHLNPEVLRETFFKAQILFPESLWVKESLLWILQKFFSKETQTAHWISENIFPLLQPLELSKQTLYTLLGQYFRSRGILDSALFYTQMARFYNDSQILWPLYLQELSVYAQYSAQKEMRNMLLQEYDFWISFPGAQFLESFLLESRIFWPSNSFPESAKKTLYLGSFSELPIESKRIFSKNHKGFFLGFLIFLILVLFLFFLQHR